MMWLFTVLACTSAPEAPPSPAAAPARVAKTWTVDAAGAGDFVAIADAIDAARSGDTISVRPGAYYGRVDFAGKTLRIASTDGAAVTTLYATPGDAAVEVDAGEGPGTVFAGFTVVGGGSADEGVVDVELSSLDLDDCVLTGGAGAHAIHGRSAQLTVRRTSVSASAATSGWLVYAQRGGIHLVDSVISCDGADIGFHTTHGAFLVDRTTLSCAGARSMWNEHSIGRVQRSNLTGLAVHEGELGNLDTAFFEDTVFVGGVDAIYGPIVVRNCLVTGGAIDFDTAATGSIVEGTVLRDAACGLSGSSAAATVRNNAWFNLTDDVCAGASRIGKSGNIEADCLHLDPAAGDWRLGAGSPCVDAGPDEAAYLDPDGSRNDIGVFGGPMSQGGGW